MTTDADSDVNKQANQIEGVVKVSTFVIGLTDKEAIGPAIKKANKQAFLFLPVTYSVSQKALKLQVTSGQQFSDELAGNAMVEVLGDEGGEVLILDFKQTNSCVLRVDGLEGLDAHNESTQTGKVRRFRNQWWW